MKNRLTACTLLISLLTTVFFLSTKEKPEKQPNVLSSAISDFEAHPQDSARDDFVGYPVHSPNLPTKESLKTEIRLTTLIEEIHEQTRDKAISDFSRLSTPFTRLRANGDLQVYVSYVEPNAMAQHVTILGGQIELYDETLGIAQAWVPFDAIHDLAESHSVKRVSLPSYARSTTPRSDRSFENEQLQGPNATGLGRKVGVISDGATDYLDSPALPSFVEQFGTCEKRERNYVSFDPGWTCNEGTAMLELVHGRARDAELAIGAVSTSLEFVTRFRQLTEQFGADAIVDDLGFYLEPYFEDGPIVRGISPYLDRVVHVSAAGNDGESFYSGRYVEAEGNSGNLVSPHNFGTDEEPDDAMSFRVFPEGYVTVLLQWDDPFGQSNSDYDIYLFLEGSSNLACNRCKSTLRQNSTDDPIEYFSFHNESEDFQTVELKVDKFRGDARNIKIYLLGTITDLEHATHEGSIFGHPAAKNVLAVGVNEAYSSRGDSTITIPNREIRRKPDLVGTDGILVSGTGGFPILTHPFQQPQFFGTSAAGPAFAATVAKMLELSPELTPTEIGNLLRGSRQESDRYIHGFRSRTGDSLFLSMFPNDDFDGDGVPNNLDDFPLNAAEVSDRDSDTIADYMDEDIDGDGIPNHRDQQPLNSSNGGRQDEREPNNEPQEANVVGSEVIGTFKNDDVDWFSVAVPYRGVLEVYYSRFSSLETENHPEITIFNERLETVASFIVELSPHSSNAVIPASVKPGEHFIRIRGIESEGEETNSVYRLSVKLEQQNYSYLWESENNDSRDTATTIELDERRYGQLSTNADIDYFKIDVDKPGNLSITGSFPGAGWKSVLTNAKGDHIESERSERFSGFSARIDEPGEYLISIQSHEDLFAGRSRYFLETSLVNDSRLAEWELEPNETRETAWQPVETELFNGWAYVMNGRVSDFDAGDWAYFDLLVETDLHIELRAWSNLEGTFRAKLYHEDEEIDQWDFGYDPPVNAILSAAPGRYFVKIESQDIPNSLLPTYQMTIRCPDLGRCGDADGDNLPDSIDTTPLIANDDDDGDGISNFDDRCPGEPGGLADRDNDGLGDDCDDDNDNDGLPDAWEVVNGLNTNRFDQNEDADNDGTTNLDEFLLGTDPNDPNEGACQRRIAPGAEASDLPYEAQVPYFAGADDPFRESVIRLIHANGEHNRGRIEIYGIDDSGRNSGLGAVEIGGAHAMQLTSTALESGESPYILNRRLCSGAGDWRLVIRSEKPLRIQSFVRAPNGFVANSLDSIKSENGSATVDIANPGSNTSRRSLLRLINESESPGRVHLTGVDDSGTSSGTAEIHLRKRGAELLYLSELEQGSDRFQGALGDGVGKWRINASADVDFRVMSFIETDLGELANLSKSIKKDATATTTLTLDRTVNGTHFVRFINDSSVSNTVKVTGFDGLGRPAAGEVSFELRPAEARQMTTDHLERGSLQKELVGMLGQGNGYWTLKIESEAPLRLLNIVRSPDGFLTNMSGAPELDNPITQRVDFFNPARNTNQKSRVNIQNTMDYPGWVKIYYADDNSRLDDWNPKWIHIWENELLAITAQELENGSREEINLNTGIGEGRGKWRLRLQSSLELEIRSILETPGGRLNNMSSSVLTEHIEDTRK